MLGNMGLPFKPKGEERKTEVLVAIDISYPGIALTSLICAGIGSYLGSYLKKKGENLATHEDLDKLVEQVAAVTQATKSIEAAISDDVWDRQKRWELKREVLFEAARRLAEIDNALRYLNTVSRFAHQQKVAVGFEEKRKAQERWHKAETAILETMLLVEIVCGNETIAAFQNFGSLAYGIVVKVSEKDFEAYAESEESFAKTLSAARAAIRKELKIDGTVTLQPSGY
jgi:hypothetical protein